MSRHIHIHFQSRDARSRDGTEYKGFTISKTLGGWYTVSYKSSAGKQMSFGEKFRNEAEAKRYIDNETKFDK